ncbi:MAG: class I SAM-dependent methyltransferase [Candidatus Thorarchaeota archaeon]
MTKYNPEMIEGHFDDPTDEEWERLDRTPKGKVQFHIHNHYLQKYIKKGDKVLEIGSGPGRFTIELAKLGANIGVVDISENQLRLNKEKIQEAGYATSIKWWKKRDIIDLKDIPDNAFDATVCYGGPFSYVLEFVDQAIDEVLRVTKLGGIVLSSVMSCLGTYHHLLNNVFIDQEIELDKFDELTRSGDVTRDLAAKGTHQCHMFRWREFKDILSKHPVDILDVSAANYLSNGLANEENLIEIMKDPEKWNMLLKWELDFSKEPGVIDAGTHFIVIFGKQ